MNSFRPFLAATGIALLAGACAAPSMLAVPQPLPAPASSGAMNEGLGMQGDEPSSPQATGLRRTDTPRMPGLAGADARGVLVAGAAGEPMPPLKGGSVNVNIEGMPVPAFINEFFGAILGAGFQMDPQVAKMNDLVTLRTSGPQTPQNFYRLAVQVLRTYGVATDYSSGLVFFSRARDGAGGVPPLVVSGRALPEVPISHRPVFQLVELQSARATDVTTLLNVAFKTEGLTIQADSNRNAIMLMGRPELVRQALDAIKVFDSPFMRGRQSARLEPAFVTAGELSKRLIEVLGAEGYAAALYGNSVSNAAVLVLPLEASNSVLVFAADRAVLEHAIAWSRDIDRPNPTGGTDGLFYYLVKNTQAKEISETINGVRSAKSGGSTRNAIDGSQVGVPPPPVVEQVPANAQSSSGTGDLARGKLTLDEPRNALIYQGSATDWGRLLPLIQQMDRAPRQVMVEVTIAEVTLTDNEDFGIAWKALTNSGISNGQIQSGTFSGLGGSGLTYLLDIGGQTRATLKAMAEKGRVNILSTPRLMVKSGEEASFDVGTEVPTITSQATSGIQTDGNTGIIQNVQYRKTGILITMKPVVYSDDRVDLQLRQEVSEAQPLGADASVKSPSIFNRSYSTNLSLKDGSAILIAGLMSQKETTGDAGVPYLKDVPVLGSLFKTQSRERSKTELVLMVVPYIIETDTEAEELTRSLRQRFELIDLSLPGPSPTTQVMPSTPVSQPAPQR